MRYTVKRVYCHAVHCKEDLVSRDTVLLQREISVMKGIFVQIQHIWVHL